MMASLLGSQPVDDIARHSLRGVVAIRQSLGQRNFTAAVAAATIFFLSRGFLGVRTIYRKYFHPLKIFPGPAEACVSEAWLQRQDANGYPEETFEALHEQFGMADRYSAS